MKFGDQEVPNVADNPFDLITIDHKKFAFLIINNK